MWVLANRTGLRPGTLSVFYPVFVLHFQRFLSCKTILASANQHSPLMWKDSDNVGEWDFYVFIEIPVYNSAPLRWLVQCLVNYSYTHSKFTSVNFSLRGINHLKHETRPGQPIGMSFWSFFSLFSAQKSYRPPMFPISVMSHCHLGSLWGKDSLVHRTEKNEYSASFLCYSLRRDHPTHRRPWGDCHGLSPLCPSEVSSLGEEMSTEAFV